MQKLHIVGIVLIAVAMMSMFSLLGNSSTYSNFREARENNEEVHVAGTLVKSKPIEYNPEVDPNSFSFYMKDQNGEEVYVKMNKIKPNDFERSEQVVVIGQMQEGKFVG